MYLIKQWLARSSQYVRKLKMQIFSLTQSVVFSACFWLVCLSGCGGGGAGGQAQVNPGTYSSLSVDSLSSEVALLELKSFNTSDFANPPSDAMLQAAGLSSVGAMGGSGLSLANPYTPAQIRSAYNMPSLPKSWATMTALEAAQMGAGQTVYVLAAYHDPNIAAELDAFSKQFSLPSCKSVDISPNTSLPLASADKSGCQFSVVYANQNSMTNVSPKYDAGWAGEIALDVEWVHATAPLARIVLIEAPDNLIVNLMNAINLANAMGPGVVSMSFGAKEGAWTGSHDSIFSAADMTYVAATGDNNAEVNWPSVSSQVLAVGGTSLFSYLNAGARNEVAWSGTGGGISNYVNLPAYQKASSLGLVSSKRNVADVAFNADLNTGQYVAIIPPNSNLSWRRYGGTSLATPQWAGVVAVTNATRALNGQGPLGLVQNTIYKAAAEVSDFFSTVVHDITSGSNGFNAASKYDVPTGLGTPDVSAFIKLAGGQAQPGASQPSPGPVPVAPVLSDITVTGSLDSSLSFSLSYTSANRVTWSLSGAPAGMLIDANSGLISLNKLIAGTYFVTVTATDKVTQARGSAVAKVIIKNFSESKIFVRSETVYGQQGQKFEFAVSALSQFTSVNFSLDNNAPAGLGIDSQSGLLTWLAPVAGDYSFNVIAKGAQSNTAASGTIHMIIRAANQPIGPDISFTPITGQNGMPLNAFVCISDPGAQRINIDISGAPAGMSYSASGPGIMLRWRRPVAGSYSLVITARDSQGLSKQVTVPVKVD